MSPVLIACISRHMRTLYEKRPIHTPQTLESRNRLGRGPLCPSGVRNVNIGWRTDCDCTASLERVFRKGSSGRICLAPANKVPCSPTIGHEALSAPKWALSNLKMAFDER